MKKALLKNKVEFNFMLDINVKVKTGKLEGENITIQNIELISKNLLKNEYITCKDLNSNLIVVETDKNKTTIRKYKGLITVTESINFFASALTQKTNYYTI